MNSFSALKGEVFELAAFDKTRNQIKSIIVARNYTLSHTTISAASAWRYPTSHHTYHNAATITYTLGTIVNTHTMDTC